MGLFVYRCGFGFIGLRRCLLIMLRNRSAGSAGVKSRTGLDKKTYTENHCNHEHFFHLDTSPFSLLSLMGARTRACEFKYRSSLRCYRFINSPVESFQEFYCCLPVIIEDYPPYCIEIIGIETDYRYGITFYHKPTLLFFLWLKMP